ncbi:MAG: sugar-transfer associated ATP-grasp domain-containing protein [bacterium]|nr:sugar-transfer associated ATP-grasp domain-containing protein [bacterium]
MASFNESIKNFNNRYYRFFLKVALYPKWMGYQNLRFKQSYLPAIHKYSKESKSLPIIIFEIIKLTLKFRCLPYHYFRYALYRRQFSFVDVSKFYPETLFYYKILPKINNNYVLLDDKNIFESMIKGSGLRYAQTVLKKKNGCVYDQHGNRIVRQSQLQNTLDLIGHTVIFCKPASYSSGGKGIFTIQKQELSWLNEENRIFDLEFLQTEMHGDWILQLPLENAKEIARIHNDSVNSFRVLTVFRPDGGSKVIYVSLKLGTSDTITDNAHTGGLYVGVDHQTGQLLGRGYDEDLNEYDMHPVSKIPFKDIRISRVSEIVEYANRAAGLFSDLTIVGWDIALCDDGPYFLEGNSSSGLTIYQRPFKGLQKLMDEIKDLIK